MQGPIKTKPPRSGAPHLSREMSRLLAKLAKKSGALDPRLAANWDEIVGPDLAKLCRPLQTKAHGRAKSLEVAVANGAAGMQLQYRLETLRQKVNAYLGPGAIARVTIRQTGKNGLAKRSAYSEIAPQVTRDSVDPATDPDNLNAALKRMKTLLDTGQH